MGTNYYFIDPPCPTCQHSKRQLHIGKSSGGWTFSFRGYRGEFADPRIESYRDWLAFLRATPGEIRDEYDQAVTLDEFIQMVESKRGGRNHAVEYAHDKHYPCWVDAEGHSFGDYEFS